MTSIATRKMCLLFAMTLCSVACGVAPESKAEASAPEKESQALLGSQCLTNADCGNSCLVCVGAIPPGTRCPPSEPYCTAQPGTCQEAPSGQYAYVSGSTCVVENFFCTSSPPVVGSSGSGCQYVGCSADGAGQYSCQQNYCFACGGPGQLPCAALCSNF
jgi:hypothetical protein